MTHSTVTTLILCGLLCVSLANLLPARARLALDVLAVTLGVVALVGHLGLLS